MNKVDRSPRAWRGVRRSWRRDKKRYDMSEKSAERRSNAKRKHWLSMSEWINKKAAQIEDAAFADECEREKVASLQQTDLW